MPIIYFLVQKFGVQGADATGILPCFNKDGLGAVVNSSRGILFSHLSNSERESCTKEAYLDNVCLVAKKCSGRYIRLKK